ncbi:MAG TPA: prepilin-type N-terminal cleavage/methylation domain-containing protein [Candidatus Dormibacteraeota bacterium]|nr:prepilin-type N-terminal cleavage/methylation domain-containing protein [Candidatus Dormibacteraeota bacterium]
MVHLKLNVEERADVLALSHHASRITHHATPIPNPSRSPRPRSGFTLLEVMIACGIFFIAVFAILALVSNTLRNARALRHVQVDGGMVAAQLLGKTNRMTLGNDSGDFGDVYPEYSWETFTDEAGTNGLAKVDIIVRKRGQYNPVDAISIMVYDPTLQQNKFGAPTVKSP